MGSGLKLPAFALRRELARYVSEGDRLRGNRTAIAAFLDPPPIDPAKEYLSVNSLEVETLAQIADYYRLRFQNGAGDVAICSIKVFDFNEAGKKCGVDLQYDRSNSSWNFVGRGLKREGAYKYRPVLSSKDHQSESHCGVEFVRVLDTYNKGKLARRLGGRRFHVVKARRR